MTGVQTCALPISESEPLVSVKGYDIESGLLFDADGERLIGVRYEAETQATLWLDPKWAARQAAVDRALQGKANVLSGKPDGPIVIRSYSDTSPARYYLMDPLLGKVSLLGASRPWVDEKHQSPGDFIRYDARDGLSIPEIGRAHV